MIEIFKDVKGYEGLYQVSNYGNVKSLRFGKERILKPSKTWDGYLQVVFSKQGKQKLRYIHRLVGQAFIDNPNNFSEINHRDEDKTNNRVENLEFCDRGYNINYGTRNKRIAESNSKRVICIETSVVYSSLKEVQRQLGFSQGDISKCCRGKQKTCGGFTWRYVS